MLNYDILVENALKGVVRQAIKDVAEHGLPGDHHFYITFRSRHPETEIPGYLRERFPEEMTIVLQYQFYDLKLDDTTFSVTLSFEGRAERLRVPFEAISIFADPSVNFALQFQPMVAGEDETTAPADRSLAAETPADGETVDDGEKKSADVVTLDQFRKK